MNLRTLAAAGVIPLLAVALSAPGAAQAAPAPSAGFGDGIYIVQLIEAPAASYDGTVAGYRATKPAKGKKLDSTAPEVVAYTGYLSTRQDATLRKVGNPAKLYNYRYSYNGFAARLSGEQATALSKDPAVLTVQKQQLYTVDTSSTPQFLGLDAQGGLWDQLGGTKKAGEDVVIGVIDSGIWPESLSFTDQVDKSGIPSATNPTKLAYQPLSSWKGKCKPGERWTASDCNKKLVTGAYFNAGQGGNAAIDRDRPWEFNSPRDYNGHGTHTAATAGGNYATPLTGAATGLGTSVSGMAPRARIAAYKALWSTESGDTASGAGSDLVAAIDKAVEDGVDVINYSVSGSSTNFLDPAEVSFLFAADAGVFVAASAGNSGPTTATVAHPSPWITTVAAGTHNRDGQGSVKLGNGATYTGASLAQAVTAPLIDSAAAGKAGADPAQVALCYSSADGGNVLDPAKVAGKIVVCDRGVTARTNKSLAVKEAGGVGMILVNTSSNSLNADFHAVPSVHLQSTDRAAVKAYAATAGATATINKATLTYANPAPFTASFSSRGPLVAGGGDLLKPDLIAPGQDILAAVSPMTAQGANFNVLSGTSMSSPHVAGLAALLKDLHPTWSPMAIKSALMTTGGDVLDGPNTNPLVIFRQGAGHVRPNSAADPGVVYDSSWNDWLAFLCGTTTGINPATCTALGAAGYSLDPSDLNMASIAIGDLAGTQTVKRKVTNVSGKSLTLSSSVTGMAGFTTTVAPATLTLSAGETKSFTVTIARDSAALGSYTGGQLTWTGGGYTARSPIVVRPLALAAPAEVAATERTTTTYPVRFGYTGTFGVTPRGLVKGETSTVVLSDDPTDTFPGPVPSASVQKVDFTVAAGTTYLRLGTFDQGAGVDDIDLYLYRGSTLVGASGAGGSTEQINLVNPTAGVYTLWVHGYAVTAPTTTFTVWSWQLGSAAAGNMQVSAPSAIGGQVGNVVVNVGDLASGKWLGSVAYSGVDGLPNPTIITVDAP